MPRSAASAKTMPQTPDSESPVEVLPSNLTLWTEMLDHDMSEEAVLEIMETLFERVMDECFQVDIRQQVIPYTTNMMKNHLVQIVQEHFLCRDEGDRPDEVPPEDSEPPTANPDSWARGCVPLVTPPPIRPISPKQEVDVVQQERDLKVIRKVSTIPQPTVSPKLPTKKTSRKLAVANINKYRNSFPPPKTDNKNWKLFKLPIHAKRSTFLPPLSQSTEKKILTAEKTEGENRFPTVNNKNSAQLNLRNKHKAIQKLDPASLPDHCVFPKYEIVDSNPITLKRANRPQRKHPKQEPQWTVESQRAEVDARPKFGTVSSSGPLRLEAMTLAKGVTLSQCLDMTQPTAPPQTPPVKLKPIKTEPAPTFLVNQFFVADPQVKPLSQN